MNANCVKLRMHFTVLTSVIVLYVYNSLTAFHRREGEVNVKTHVESTLQH